MGPPWWVWARRWVGRVWPKVKNVEANLGMVIRSRPWIRVWKINYLFLKQMSWLPRPQRELLGLKLWRKGRVAHINGSSMLGRCQV